MVIKAVVFVQFKFEFCRNMTGTYCTKRCLGVYRKKKILNVCVDRQKFPNFNFE